MPLESWDDDDDAPRRKPGAVLFDEFDCPECDANNPWGDGFKDRDEVFCHYCGTEFEARVDADGKLTLKRL